MIAWWWIAAAWSDEPAAPPPPDEDEDALIVEVIGSRADEVGRYPGSAVVIDAGAIESAAPLSGNDVLRTAPGLHVVDEEGVGLRMNLGVRGLDPNRSRKVLVLEDGVPIALNPYGEPESYYTPPIERMDRIEIVKGSGSVLFGPQTVGGVVNYITRDPPDRFRATMDVRGGSWGYGEVQASVGDRVGSTGWRLDTFVKHFDGPRSLGLKAADIAGKVVFDPGADQRAWIKLDVYHERSASTYLGLTTPMFERDPSLVLAPHDHLTLSRYAVSAGHAWTPSSRVQLRSVVYAHQIHRDWLRQDYLRLDDGRGGWERTIGGVADDEVSDDGGSLYFPDTSAGRYRVFHVVGLEERLRLGWTPPKAKVDVELGARVHGERARDQLVLTEPAGAVSGSIFNDEVRTGSAFAGWAQVDVQIADRVRLTPGVRYELFSRQRDVFLTQGEVVNTSSRDALSAIIPGFGLSVSVADPLRLYAGVHRGFAPPRTKDSFTTSGDNLQLGAEYSWNYELGARLAIDGLQAELTGFIMDFRNQVVPPSEAGGAATAGGALVEGVSTLHTGFEASVRLDAPALAGRGWSLPVWGTYTYSRSVFTDGPYDGNFLPYAPFHQGTGGVQLALRSGFEADVRVRAVSAQITDPENTVEPTNDGLRGRIDAYAVLDAQVAWRAPLPAGHSLRVFVAGKNLTNHVYIASRSPAGIQPAGFLTLLGGGA
ncbi:MAG TPA: TonB-dependent receptor, partial [Myxococcota bacterium]|nr:TonB-dependent receptor [Myxococcota bacterium]